MKEDDTLEFEDFKGEIDKRKGYMQGVATSHMDIRQECLEAREIEQDYRGTMLKRYESEFTAEGMRPDTAAVFAEMLLPPSDVDLDKDDGLGVYD